MLMENERVLCRINEIDFFDEQLTALLDSAPSSLLHTVDESGFQPWADAHDNVAIAPQSHP
jgi:hypothetical protein